MVVSAQPRAARSVHVDPVLADEPGDAVRIGLIVLATDHTSERDFRRILPESVDVFVSRVACRTVTTIDSLGELARDLTQAGNLLLPGSTLHGIAFACTSGAIVIGDAQVARRIALACPGIPVTTPIQAATEACRVLQLRRLAVVLPYVQQVNQRVLSRLQDDGLDVVSVATFDLESDRDMARISPTSIIEAALRADHPDAQGVFLSCTALRGAEVADGLEQRLGKPVLTSNQALCWHLLRLTGVATKVAGYGSLLREH